MDSVKYYSILFLFFLLLVPIYTIGQGSDLKILGMKRVNDSLQLKYSIKPDVGSISSGQALSLSPVLILENHYYPLRPLIIAGKNKHQVLKRWTNNYKKKLPSDIISRDLENDSVLYFDMCVPYLQKADSARILVRSELVGYRGKRTFVPDINLSKAISDIKILPQVTFIIPQKENKSQYIEESDSIFFKIGDSDINSTYGKNRTKLFRIEQKLQDIVDNKNIIFSSVHIQGYASPDGKYQINEALASRRALSLKNYIERKFAIPDSLFITEITPEDWTGLVTLIEVNKPKIIDDIKNIISTKEYDEREVKLKKLDYNTIQKLFPLLRRSEYKIYYSINDYNSNETEISAEKGLKNRSQLELYNLALDYGQGSPEYKQILTETIPSYYPYDAVAINNAAAVMIMEGKLDTARNILNKASTNVLLSNNIGVIYLMENNIEEASRHFDRAIASGSKEAMYNKKKYCMKDK